MITIVGSYISPYVRKVLVCLDLKKIEYQVDPIVPFSGNDSFSNISPLRRIPVLLDGDLVIPDSTIICAYLEEQYPGTSLYPSDPSARARARWLEEYADSRIGEVFIWRYFNELIIKPFVWREKTDPLVLSRAANEEIPGILTYLENTIPQEGYIFGELSIADLSIASFFRNLFLANFELDHNRWSRVSRLVRELHNLPSFAKLKAYEELSVKTPIAHHRQALLEAGAPISEGTFFTAKPRRGILSM